MCQSAKTNNKTEIPCKMKIKVQWVHEHENRQLQYTEIWVLAFSHMTRGHWCLGESVNTYENAFV